MALIRDPFADFIPIEVEEPATMVVPEGYVQNNMKTSYKVVIVFAIFNRFTHFIHFQSVRVRPRFDNSGAASDVPLKLKPKQVNQTEQKKLDKLQEKYDTYAEGHCKNEFQNPKQSCPGGCHSVLSDIDRYKLYEYYSSKSQSEKATFLLTLLSPTKSKKVVGENIISVYTYHPKIYDANSCCFKKVCEKELRYTFKISSQTLRNIKQRFEKTGIYPVLPTKGGAKNVTKEDTTTKVCFF